MSIVKLEPGKLKVLIGVRPLVILGLAATIAVGSGCEKKTAKLALSEALSLAEDGGSDKWVQANALVENSIKQGVTDERVVKFYIICLYNLKKYKRALRITQEQLADNPDDFLVNYFAGKIYYETEQYQTAETYLTRCNSIRPNHLDTLVLLTNCSRRLNHPRTAELYEKLLGTTEFSRSFLAMNGLGVCYTEQKRYPHAMSKFSSALKYSDQHPMVHLNIAILGDRYLHLPEIAERHYQQFLDSSSRGYSRTRNQVIARLENM